MSEIISHITDARKTGTINVYAVRYNHRGKNDNVAVALPGNLNYDFILDFCNNVIAFQGAKETAFNPTVDGLENGTYEFIPLVEVYEKWNGILTLLTEAVDYHGQANRKKVPLSNLFICALDYNNYRYYLCAKQGRSSDRLLKGKVMWSTQQDELKVANPSEVFIMNPYTGFVIDTKENKLLIFDKKNFQEVFKYDDFQKERVQKEITKVDSWKFLESTELIKQKSRQKNVYQNLAKIFADDEYMEQIKQTAPARLKQNLLNSCSEYFSEKDFDGDCLIVSQQNLETIMKMLAKGFKFNFFTNSAEQQ